MARRIVIWDRFVRLFHWSLAAGILLNYAVVEDGGTAHLWIGYVIGAMLVLRLIWGFVGPQHARFADFFPTPARLRTHLHELRSRQLPVAEGHNPAGGMMILLMLGLVAGVVTTGIMMEHIDAFWGEDWVEALHETLATALIVAASIHVTAVIWIGRWCRQALIRPMLTGYREVADPVSVPPPPAHTPER